MASFNLLETEDRTSSAYTSRLGKGRRNIYFIDPPEQIHDNVSQRTRRRAAN
jgi:hypothetical protein